MKTNQNMSLGSNWGNRVRSLIKIPMQVRGITLALIAPVQPISHRVSCSNETIQDAPKHYKMHQFCTEFRVVTKHCQMHRNTTKCSRTRVCFQRGGSSAFFEKKIPMRLYGTNLCVNCTSSTRLAPSFM